ncbi:hypothetical protein CVT24_010100 [Panaeolus cyanescens]|uniref:Uncharacterized protein n=1 Tax=Panaeolus cyanescens TaxID=181874 RepID=A0A409W9G2_9AGAR|nr:hypothetical protein CVT24_010100 [Panaeolus cyanescens]
MSTSGSLPPSTPDRRSSPTPPMDSEEAAQMELEAMMKTPGSDEPTDMHASDDADELPQPAGSGTEPSNLTSRWTNSSLRIESERARKMAIARKLTPYQRELVDDYIKMPQLSRSISLFIQQCEILNKLEAVVTNSATFVVSSALMENIKAYVTAVLLSSKLAAYKGNTPRDHVMTLVRREGLHLPENYENDASIVRTISNAVSEELTQSRARVKKELKASITDHQTIYDLANSLTHNTKCVVTPALCARLAFLPQRAMYVKDSSPNGFWSGVDSQLRRIRKAANDDAVKITRAFKVYLENDRTKHGGTEADAPSLSPLSATWQESVDGIIEAN